MLNYFSVYTLHCDAFSWFSLSGSEILQVVYANLLWHKV